MPAINCVNINSKEFKNTVKDLNVSSGDLELIVHKFQNIEGNEDKFPSYLYIKKQLYGTPFRASDVQRRLYEKSGHASPLVFSGEDAYLNKLAELSKFYPKSAISSYKNTEGDYIINVGIPFTTTDYKVSQIKNEDANKIRQELEKLTKNFTDATHVTYELDRIKDFHIGFVSKEELYKILNTEVKKLNRQFGTRVTVDKNLEYHNNLEAEEEEYERLSDSLKNIESKIIEDKNIILKETLTNILEEERRDATKHEEELYNPYGYDAETMSAMPDIQFSVEKTTPEQVFFDNEIVPQIIDHLKAQGINVYNREKLVEYLKNHDYRKQQMAFEAEMQSIKQKAIADGTFMKAPNGNPTNLTERQWLQVRTKAFKDWFGDWENDPANASKVVDENGEPKVVYHGSKSKNKISVFDSYHEKGTFFSTSKNVSSTFSTNENNLYSVFINSKNPLIVDNNGKDWYNINAEDLVEAAEKMFSMSKEEYLESLGEDKTLTTDGIVAAIARLSEEENSPYDGFILKNVVETKNNEVATDIVTVKSNQIKSATDNIGTFSRENDDIRYFIGKKARTKFEQQLHKMRPDMSDAEIQATLNLLHLLKDEKENNAYIKDAVRWIANKSLNIRRDQLKARQAFDEARKRRIDTSKFKTLGDLIASPEMQPKERGKKEFDPDKASTFSNKRTVTTESGREFTVYDVENTEEGQREVCKALAAHYSVSPWCLSTFTATGEPTGSAKKYWEQYNGIQRKIAYEGGKPVAFSSEAPQGIGGWHTIDGIEFYVFGEFTKTGDELTAIDYKNLSIEKSKEWTAKGYLHPNLTAQGNYALTDKGIAAFEKQKQEAWWDTEDRFPQDNLSDSIVNNSSKINRTTEDELTTKVNQARLDIEQEVLENFTPEQLKSIRDELIEATKQGVLDYPSKQIIEDFVYNTICDFYEIVGHSPTVQELIDFINNDQTLKKEQHGIATEDGVFYQDPFADIEDPFADMENPFIDEEDYNNYDYALTLEDDIFNYSRGVLDNKLSPIIQYDFGDNLPTWLSTGVLTSLIINEFAPYSTVENFINEHIVNEYNAGDAATVYANEIYANLIENEHFKEEVKNRILELIRIEGERIQQENNQLNIEYDEMPFYLTPEGEVYGFLDKDGNIYLDETVIKPEHPIHEYTHLWDRAVQQRQPELWSRGVDLMKQTSLWNQILADTSYGQRWKEMGITGERLDNLIASEAHARFVGEGGQKLLNDLAKEKGQKGIIAKLKQWILDVWKALGKTFGTWSDEALNNLTLKDFNHLTMRDFAMGTPLKESKQQTTANREITYTPVGKQKQTYEIRDNKIFNKEGQEVFKEDSKDRRKIFANLAVKEGRAVVVEHKGKSYVVDNQDSIISVTSGDLMKWGEENGDRKAILQAAKEKFAEKQQSQNNTANQNTQAIEQETPAQNMSSEIFYDKQSANEYIQDMIDAGVPKEQIKIEYTKAEGDYDQYWTVKYPKQQKQEQKQDKVGSELTSSELSFYSRGRKYTDAAYNLQGMVTAISKGKGTKYWMTEEGSRVKQEITDLAKEISYTDAPVEEKINEALEYIPSVEDAEVTKIIENYLFGTGENTKESVLKKANEFYNSLEKKVYAEDNIENNEKAPTETISETPVNNNSEVAKSPTIEDIVGENNTNAVENVENTETSKEDLEDTEDNESENDFDDEVENKRTPEEKKEAQKTLLEKAKKIEEQINNLNNNEYLTPSEVRRAADLAVYHISDLLTEACKSNENLERIFGIKSDTDVTTLSRLEVAKLIGGNNIISRLKAAFKNADFDDFDMLDKRDAILDNFEALMVIAQNTFLYMEDFSVISEDGKAYTLNTDVNPDLDEGTNSNDADVINENEGSEQEHWQVETKTLDILGTMTPVVKQMLRECYVLNPDGSKVVTEWGVYDRVPLRQATNSIVRWIQGSITLRDAISKLKERQENNPWIKQVIDKLESENDQDAYLQSQFISVFLKPFQPYTIIVKEDGKYKSITVNENPALKEAMKGIMALYKIQEHHMFTSDGTINKSTFDEFSESLKELNTLTAVQNLDLQNEETKKNIATNIGYIANALGYTVTPEMVESILSLESLKTMKSALGHIERALKLNMDNKNYDPFKYGAKGSIYSNLRAFLKPITEILEDTAISSVYDAGKMYQSYITPSYMTKLFQKFHNSNEESFLEFLQKEYGNYDWFRDQEEGDMRYGWRNSWLAIIAQNTEDREVLKHKTQLNFNKKQYMKDMDDLEYVLASLTEYFSEYVNDGNPLQKAWFRVPMQSNKPSSEYIRFYSRNGSMYKQELTEDFLNIFNQELSRIQTVMMRNYDKTDDRFITNLDSNGRKFNFLEFFNDYLDGNNKDSELGKLINDKVNGKAVDEVTLNRLAKDQIFKTINDRVQRILAQFENQGILEAAKSIKGIEGDVKGHIENFLWNDTLAAMNIMELTITDIAYYKNAEDLQKRLAQLHAPGIRGNAEIMYHTANKITGEEGKRSRISDGLSRTIYLKDFDDYISNVIDNVSIVFDKKIAAAPENEKKVWEDLKESLVGEKGAYREINVADAQAYNSITSYRKKALIFGKWSTQAEQTYKKLLKGDYTISDIQMAFQPLKPFVYSQIPKSSNVDNAPIKTFKMGVQNKNSEYLLILADALTQNEDTGIPNMLRVISEIMEESHYDKDGNYKNDGIDTVQFESTVKTGLMGRTDLTKYISMKDVGADTAKEVLLKHIYGADGKYNPTYVHEIPYEDYCLQQEVPEHFKNHEQSHGSQIRYIVVSELAETDGLGNKYTYTIRDGKKERNVGAKEFKEEYEKTISENIEQSISELEEEFGLSGLNMKDRNIALSKILQREILSSPRYGVDLLLACSVDENGRFRIPLGDPIQSKRVEQLINSIVKNRICKQTIAGGPIVQVSNFGTSKHLSIKFKDKQGNLLKTRSEFEGTDEEFKNYLKENQAGIAYFEVYAPIYANELLSKFADKNGNINIKAIEKLNPDLLKLVGYRIPTEAKYSMAPLKIVGFLPREAGDGIMMPYEITLLSGSDFDVDKEYVMRKVINIRDKYSNEIKKINKNTQLSETTKERERKKIIDNHSKNVRGALVNTLLPKFNNFATSTNMVEINRAIDKFLKDPFDEKAFINEDGKLYNSSTYDALLDTYVNNMYDAKFPPRNSKLGRNNKIVDMTYEVLTHEQSCAEMLNPGGFEPQKRMGYLVSAYKNPASKFTWKELESKTTKELKELSSTGKNLMYFDTHVQFYKQNSAAGSLIGIFAVHRTAHAALETDGFKLDVASLLGKKVQDTINYSPFKILNTSFDSTMEIDPRFDTSGQSVGKVLGSLVASAADAVKDPVLNLTNINSNTANILNTLVRLGMPFEDAALFLSQTAVENVLTSFSKAKITKFKALNEIIKERIDKLKKELGITDDSPLFFEDITKEELIEGLRTPSAKTELKVLNTFKKIQTLSSALRLPTMATRFNSVTSAPGPMIIDNLATEFKLKKLNEKSAILDANLQPVDASHIFKKHPILNSFYKAQSIATQLLGNMPANSNGFRNLISYILNSNLGNTIINDRNLLSKLSDFYQTCLAYKGGVVESEDLDKYINEFPKKFNSKNYKETYKNNYLISSIKLDTDKQGRTYLYLDTTGIDAMDKEKLSSAWATLHRENAELSTKLFKYCLFKGGVGFSPRTFMSLLPIQIKEKLDNYLQTYRVLPSLDEDLVINQFIRNNADSDKLVPKLTNEDKYTTEKDRNKNANIILDEKTSKKYFGDLFIKQSFKDSDLVLYQCVGTINDGKFTEGIPEILSENDRLVYKKVDALGSNKNYIEINMKESIEQSLDSKFRESLIDSKNTGSETSNDIEKNKISDIDSTDNTEAKDNLDTVEDAVTQFYIEHITDSETTEDTQSNNDSIDEEIKAHIQDIFDRINIPYNKDFIDDFRNKLC